MPRALSADERPEWVRAIPYLLVHFASLGVFFVPFRWYYPVIAVGLYFVRMFFLTAAYHRYFAHRTYKTSRWFQFILALGGATCTQIRDHNTAAIHAGIFIASPPVHALSAGVDHLGRLAPEEIG